MAHHITKEQVKAWTRRHKNDKVIGQAACEENCPLVTFLSDTYGLKVIYVGELNYAYQSDFYKKEINKTMPVWAREVVNKVDRIRRNTPVTMGEFKTILREVDIEV